MPGVFLTWVKAPEIVESAQPGQFVMVRCCGDGYDPLLRRPLSIHRINGKTLALLYAVVGRGTEWLSQRQEGDVLDIIGALGNGFSAKQNSKKLLLVAGGIGIASLVFLAESALESGHEVTMLYGARESSLLYPESELPAGLKFVIVTEDGSRGQKGLITDALPDCVAEDDQVFACGPTSMYRALSSMEELVGKPVQVSLEQVLGCGYGVCYGCTIDTENGPRKVCQDGPVFDLKDIIWDSVADPR